MQDSLSCDIIIVQAHPHDTIAEKIGEIVLDDWGLSVNCSEIDAVNYLKKEACALGAQIVLVKKRKRPNLKSYCFKCTGVFYKLRPNQNPAAVKDFFSPEKVKKREEKDRKMYVMRTLFLVEHVRLLAKSIVTHIENHKALPPK